jgi:hypothetical protein
MRYQIGVYLWLKGWWTMLLCQGLFLMDEPPFAVWAWLMTICGAMIWAGNYLQRRGAGGYPKE